MNSFPSSRTISGVHLLHKRAPFGVLKRCKRLPHTTVFSACYMWTRIWEKHNFESCEVLLHLTLEFDFFLGCNVASTARFGSCLSFIKREVTRTHLSIIHWESYLYQILLTVKFWLLPRALCRVRVWYVYFMRCKEPRICHRCYKWNASSNLGLLQEPNYGFGSNR